MLYRGSMEDIATVIAEKYRAFSGVSNETTLRLWAAVEARSLGHGGVSMVVRAIGAGGGGILDGIAPLREGRRGRPAGTASDGRPGQPGRGAHRREHPERGGGRTVARGGRTVLKQEKDQRKGSGPAEFRRCGKNEGEEHKETNRIMILFVFTGNQWEATFASRAARRSRNSRERSIFGSTRRISESISFRREEILSFVVSVLSSRRLISD